MADGFFSVEGELSAAEQAHAQGRYAAAETHLRRLAQQTRAVDYEYDDWIRRLADVYKLQKRPADAAVCYMYLHYFQLAREALPKDSHEALGRTYALEKRWPEAAQALAQAGLRVQAAVAWEEAKQPAKAAELWRSLIGDPRLRDRPYERALVHFNLGMALERARDGEDKGGGAASESTAHLINAQRLLEQVADDYETAGERERAFDCYQILLKLGQDSGQFENLAEGYLNCIRILKEDGLKFYVLQYYEDFLELALARVEYHAAAQLYREAAEYALRAGLPYHRYYLRRAADTWWREAERGIASGAPIELIENAYLASIDCLSLTGNFARVRETYQRLAALDLPERKRARYTEIPERYSGAPNEEGEGLQFPQYLRQPRAYGDIWFVDLVEWEHDGDPERVAAAIVGDLRYPDGIRRRAVNLVLEMAAARQQGEVGPDTLAAVAQSLGELQSYAALSALERLYQHVETRVRRAAVRALRHLYFKRSFGLLGKGLADRETVVREAAVEALRGLHFAHAFHPLTRIFREHPDERVKSVALESIGRIGTIEAAEQLVGVIRQETGALRDVARRALALFDDADVVPILRQHLELEGNPEVRKMIEEVLSRPRRR
jgi:hypothetical protein